MSLELEVSRSFVRSTLMVLAVIGLTVIGYYSSPQSENHQPLLLSPGLARILRYQGLAQKWISQLQHVDADLAGLLDQNETDLFTQDQQVSRVYGWLAALQVELDGTEVPPTLETLHLQFTQSVSAYLEATRSIAQWISEPTQANHSAAITTLTTASQSYRHIQQNPWLQVGP